MDSIEEIKKEITLRVMENPYTHLPLSVIEGIPKNDELRTFVCQLCPKLAYLYAFYIDKCVCAETRTSCCRDPQTAYGYARYIEQSPNDETRKAACKHPKWAYDYAYYVDKCERPDTKESALKDPQWRYWYQLEISKDLSLDRYRTKEK